MAARIDTEVRKLIDGAHDEAVEILRTHRATLDRLASALIDQETLDTPHLMEILGDLPPWATKARVDAPPPAPVAAASAVAPRPAYDEPGATSASAAVRRLRRKLRRATNRPATA
jgi:cell division protease FtsH